MTYSVELHSENKGRQILGNMDGQTIIVAKQYKRTHKYRNLRNLLGRARDFRKDQSLYYKIVEVSPFKDDVTVEVIK